MQRPVSHYLFEVFDDAFDGRFMCFTLKHIKWYDKNVFFLNAPSHWSTKEHVDSHSCDSVTSQVTCTSFLSILQYVSTGSNIHKTFIIWNPMCRRVQSTLHFTVLSKYVYIVYKYFDLQYYNTYIIIYN